MTSRSRRRRRARQCHALAARRTRIAFGESVRTAQVLGDDVRRRVWRSAIAVQNIGDGGMHAPAVAAEQRVVDCLADHHVLEARAVVDGSVPACRPDLRGRARRSPSLPRFASADQLPEHLTREFATENGRRLRDRDKLRPPTRAAICTTSWSGAGSTASDRAGAPASFAPTRRLQRTARDLLEDERHAFAPIDDPTDGLVGQYAPPSPRSERARRPSMDRAAATRSWRMSTDEMAAHRDVGRVRDHHQRTQRARFLCAHAPITAAVVSSTQCRSSQSSGERASAARLVDHLDDGRNHLRRAPRQDRRPPARARSPARTAVRDRSMPRAPRRAGSNRASSCWASARFSASEEAA